jgi:hypothetical protein
MPSTHAVRRTFAGLLFAVTFTFSAVGLASAAPPNVTSMVVSKAGVILQPTTVSAHSFTIPVGSRKCTVAEGTPLAALKATGIVFHVKDYAKCSTKPSASAGLFLDRILTTSNTGTSGWTFKVNNRAGTAGSADASGPFGNGPLASGDKVVWFWCVFDANWACQRNLAISAPSAASPGSTITVTVTAVDDFGAAIPAGRVKITAGATSVNTASDGTAKLKLPSSPGSVSIRAFDSVAASTHYVQRVPSFPAVVAVG